LRRHPLVRKLLCWAAVAALPALTLPSGPLAADPVPDPDRPTVTNVPGPAPAKDGAAAAPAKGEKKAGEPKEKDSTKEPGLRLEFLTALDSRTAKKGQVVPLRVVEDVTVDGKLRFRKDAEASGIIEGVDPPGRFGKRARIRLRLDWVKDVNGNQVPLKSYTTGNRFELGAGGASLGGAIFLGPLGLLGGALIKGGHIQIKQGTRINARSLRPAEEKKSEQQKPAEEKKPAPAGETKAAPAP
jgi:hypothetical protein